MSIFTEHNGEKAWIETEADGDLAVRFSFSRSRIRVRSVAHGKSVVREEFLARSLDSFFRLKWQKFSDNGT